MQIAPPITPYHLPTNSSVPSERNDHQAASSHQRHRRSIDSSPPKDQKVVQEVVPDTNSSKDGYTQVNVDPDPGKGVGAGEKVPVPVNLGPNINVDPVIQKVSGAFKTVKEEASIFLKTKFAEMAAKATTPAEREKWDIDPDNTYLVTYDYNTTGEKPYPAKIIKRISLTEALITNAQDTPTGAGYQIPFYPGGPEVIVNPELKTHLPGVFNFGSRFSPYTEKADITHTYQGIYIESTEGPAPIYNGGNQSSITPDEFKQLIWKADYQKPYDQFLNEFWSKHEKNYPLLAKASLVKAAMSQHQEQSLSKEARDLVMRASGLSGNEASWPDIKLEDLQKNPPKDPDIEVGMLKVGNFQSTDLMYITDKKLPPLTLLHIPGNSSPIHTFNSPSEMKAWFAEQMADPVKREAMAGHFPLKDKPNGYAQAGIDETLAGLGTWPEKRETPGGILSYDHRAFSGFWDPQDFIKTEASHSPFDEITTRQKDRSYADAAVDITSDRDVTKNKIISGLEKAAKAALFLTPLAFVMPEVALTLDAFYLASGLTEAGIGIDDKIHGKPTGNQRIIFGVFNAALAVAPHVTKVGRTGEGAANEIKPAQTTHSEEPLPESGEHTSSPPSPESQTEAYVNRQPGIDSNEINDYAVEDGEQLISDVAPNTRGIYQVKGPRGEDRWLIKVSYDENTTRVFEIQSSFKLEGNTVEIIDPFTRKPVMTVHNIGDETWEAVRTRGGGKPIPKKQAVPKEDAVPISTSSKPLTNHKDWQSILDSGTYNGKPVYIHYTDKAGLEAITQQRRISDALRSETRAGSKGGIYVNPPGQQFNGENVENLLFLGNERYVGRGNYMVIFSSDQVPQNLGPITSGSPFVELKMPKDINLTPSNILYMGPNKFPDYFG